ncbi:hypothetical protein V5799_014374 [Amblyomma americanum]|uniref:BEN domain-containing protein n=1 Tax=Amblyomma americanum TaxID=6943 RepID=A0AAQ4E391_AMBAM
MPQGEDHARSVQRQRLIEEVLQEYELSFMPMRAHAAVQSRVLPTGLEQLDGTRHNNNQGQSLLTAASTGDVPRSVHMALKEKHDALARDIKELRSLNGDLQKSLKSKIFRAEGKLIYATSNDVTMTAVPATTLAPQAANGHTSSHGGCAESNVPSEGTSLSSESITWDTVLDTASVPDESNEPAAQTCQCGAAVLPSHAHGRSVTAAEGSNFDIVDGQVQIGPGISMPEEKWRFLMKMTTDAKFAVNAARFLWTHDEASVRSLTGEACRSRPCSTAKLPATPEKVDIFKNCLRKYVDAHPNADVQRESRVAASRHYLRSFFTEAARQGKRKRPRPAEQRQ